MTGSSNNAARVRPDSGPPRTVRAAFTLLELVLALAVIAALVGLAWPVMIRFAGEQSLKRDVDAVRARLARTRLTAMESGLTFQFRYEPDGRRCLVLPAQRPLDDPQETAGRSASPLSQPAAHTPAPRALLLELDEGHRFLSAPPGPAAFAQPEAVERIPDDWLTAFGASPRLAEVAWGPAIRFAPDGTAQDASFVIADEEGRFQVLRVRGLTAAVYVGPVERERR